MQLYALWPSVLDKYINDTIRLNLTLISLIRYLNVNFIKTRLLCSHICPPISQRVQW